MDSSRTALVTGGSGFIGSRVAAMLAGRGIRVRVASSDPGRRAAPASGIEVVKADLADPRSLAAAGEGCGTVFHFAYRFGGSAAEQQRVNLEATRALAGAALRSGARLVHASSVAAYGDPADGDLDETTPPRPSSDPYCATKQASEAMLRDLHRTQGLAMTILQPTIVYGPRGTVWTSRLIDQIRTHRVALPAAGQGLCNAVYVDDVANAALLAAEREAGIGETFLISGAQPTTWLAFYRGYEAMVGRPAVVPLDDAAFEAELAKRYGTVGPLRTVRRVAERVSNRLRRPSPNWLWLPDPGTRQLYAAKTRVRIDKARTLLGYAPAFDLAAGLAATAAWVKAA